jgi:hypothetical protein
MTGEYEQALLETVDVVRTSNCPEGRSGGAGGKEFEGSCLHLKLGFHNLQVEVGETVLPWNTTSIQKVLIILKIQVNYLKEHFFSD